jgi:hypothetical protein
MANKTEPIKCPICGQIRQVRSDNVPKLKTNTCRSCYRKSMTKHGESRTRLYYIWAQTKSRCLNPNDPHYNLYGGREEYNGKPAVKWFKAWFEYPIFKKWAVTHGYDDSKKLVRKDKNGSYTPDNCQWM